MPERSTSRAIKDFLGEAEEIIEKLNLDLVALGDSGEMEDSDPERINGIFRGAHSIKGLAGMFGFEDISELAHRMENLLDGLRLGKVSMTETLVEVLFDSLEALTRLVHGKGESEDFTFDLNPLLGRINAIADGVEDASDNPLAALRLDSAITSVLTEYEEHRLLENIKKGRHLFLIRASFMLTSFDQELAELTDLLKSQGELISTLPSAGDMAERISFQLLVGTARNLEQIKELLQNDDLAIEQISRGKKGPAVSASPAPQVPTEVIPPRKEAAAAPAPATVPREDSGEGGETSLRSISRTVRVDIDKLDSLMNIVGELVLSKGAIGNICERLKAEGATALANELQKATRTLERRLDELQKGVMEVRMVPVSQLFEKMMRIVRRVAHDHGKKVSLDIRGADTELDKLIVEDLSDPLMHIIRNSLDHGIESPEERTSAGKPETGTICLWASQKGNHVVIEVSDDGRGVDPELVRRKAVKKGLIAEGAELSREDIYDLLFAPGFSTRDEVSEISGRGVGMDVVKTNIAALSGMVEMDSTIGEGTTLTITLPITLAIIKALIIEVSGRIYAVPINSVMETLLVEPSAIRTIERREVMELRQSTLPLLRLNHVFNLPRPMGKDGRSYVVVVGLADKKMGIIVDELQGQQDVVIKSLGSTLSFVRGVAGAADLGNQKTILVLDVGGLMSEALRGESALYV